MANSITSDQGWPVPIGPTPQPVEAALEGAVDTWRASIDWDPRFNAVDMLKKLIDAWRHGHVVANDYREVAKFLWSQTPAFLQKKFPGAEYGMTPDVYEMTTTRLSNKWYDMTGQTIPHAAMTMALGNLFQPSDLESWIFDEALRKQGGDKNAPAWLDLKSSPWLLSGVSYQSAAQQYTAIAPPGAVNVGTVRGWWNFVSEARELSTTKPVSLGDDQNKGFKQQSETR